MSIFNKFDSRFKYAYEIDGILNSFTRRYPRIFSAEFELSVFNRNK